MCVNNVRSMTYKYKGYWIQRMVLGDGLVFFYELIWEYFSVTGHSFQMSVEVRSTKQLSNFTNFACQIKTSSRYKEDKLC